MPLHDELAAIDWDSLPAAKAVELRQSLRDALTKSEVWFEQLWKGFGSPSGTVPPKPIDNAVVVPPSTAAPKRGRPRKANLPLATAPASPDGDEPHPPILGLKGSYVGWEPDSSVPHSLPPGHPRASGVVQTDIGDADFREASKGKVNFN
jgi:hypothetical protein